MKEKLISKSLYSKELNNLTSSKVLSINELNGKIEIKYVKNGVVAYLTMTTSSHPSDDMKFRKCYFDFGEEELPQSMLDAQDLIYDNTETIYVKKPCDLLDSIVYIHHATLNLLYHYSPDAQCEEIIILANTADDKLKKYRLGFELNDEIYMGLSVTFEQISNAFISKSLNEENLVITISFNDKYINYSKTVDSINEDKTISRLHTPNWCEIYNKNSDTKIELVEDSESFYISGVDFYILKKGHFLLFDDEDKRAFFAFVEVLLLYLRTLFINRVFKYKKTYHISGSENYEKFLEHFKQNGFLLEEVYLLYCDRGFLEMSINKATKNGEIVKIVLAYHDWVLDEYGVVVEYDNLTIDLNI